MDPRVQPVDAHADGAFMLRNAGGRVTDDVIRSLVLCTRMLGATEITVLHHSDCRLQGVTNDELALLTGASVDFLTFEDSATTVSEDVHRLRTCGLFDDDITIWGGIYFVEDQTTTIIVPPV